MKDFQNFIAIDWSGAKAIRTQSIAVAKVTFGTDSPALVYPDDGGPWSRQMVEQFIEAQTSKSHRTLISIDCNFSYAKKILVQQFPEAQSAFNLWEKVDEYSQEAGNYFAQPFWTHANIKNTFWLKGKKPENFTIEKRLAEIMCGQQGFGWPESPFKLIGPKQVGKGGLAGMRMLHNLRKALKQKIAVWPFDSCQSCNNAQIVVTEIYPRLFIRKAGYGSAKLKTSEELNKALNYFKTSIILPEKMNDHQADAMISATGMRYLMQTQEALFDVNSLPLHLQNLIHFEGWILGVKPD